MASKKRNAEWRIEGERNGKVLKLVSINNVPAKGTASTSASVSKGQRRWLQLLNAAASPVDQMPPALLRHQGLLETLRRMGVPSPTCVFQKQLTNSDIDAGQNRLQLSREGVRKSALYRLLTSEEKADVEGGTGMKVRVWDPMGREHAMTFLLYPKSIKQYRFISPDYGKLVRENRWQAGQTLDLWGSRLRGDGGDDGQGKLVVAMLNHRREEEEEEEEDEKEPEAQLDPQVSDDHELYGSDTLTSDEREVAGILCQMREL